MVLYRTVLNQKAYFWRVKPAQREFSPIFCFWDNIGGELPYEGISTNVTCIDFTLASQKKFTILFFKQIFWQCTVCAARLFAEIWRRSENIQNLGHFSDITNTILRLRQQNGSLRYLSLFRKAQIKTSFCRWVRNIIVVPDHDGGRPMEVNACILITNMVYL